MTIYDDQQSAELLAAELQAEIAETGTDPTATAPQPAPLDLDAIDAALAHPLQNRPWREIVRSLVAEVRRLRAERDMLAKALVHPDRLVDATALDAAPAAPRTYQLPAEPAPEVTALWDWEGVRWDRTAPRTWQRALEADDPWWRRWTWLRLLDKRGPLSTVPPAGTEGEW